MLMIQAYKAHLSVLLLAQDGHIEDAATICRRLLELAIQAIYIGADDTESVRIERASRFVADLWDNLGEGWRARLPAPVSDEWQKIHDAVGPLPPKRPRWGPTFKQMFEYAEKIDTYDQDYTYLSKLAHGSSEELVLRYSYDTVLVRSTPHVGMLLVFSSRYYLSVAEIWNRAFNVFGDSALNEFVRRSNTWIAAQ
jgi:hypothetical protein